MKIPATIRDEMIRHLLAAAPEEGCGLLAADAGGVVRRAYCMANTDASPVAYTLDPSEHIRALHDAESNGWRLAAVFHSHPLGPAVPSRIDVSKALEPEWVYLIVGLADRHHPELRGYRIVAGAVTEEPLEVAV